jgi:hypothetical protein
MAYMWNRREAAATLLLALALGACKGKQTVKLDASDDEGPRISSIVHMGDPKSETQLVDGFYGIEQNSWRWTAQKFSVVLRPPAGAAQKGATLNLQLAVSDATIGKLKTIALAASIGGAALAPETYTQAGPYTFTRDVPASQLAGEAVRIDFQLDKALPPNGADQRNLGLIVNSVALDAK